jgi:hypothetical protein
VCVVGRWLHQAHATPNDFFLRYSRNTPFTTPVLSQYFTARETFVRKDNPADREWMGIVSVGSGDGMVHTQSRKLNGRKYWAWGRDPADVSC